MSIPHVVGWIPLEAYQLFGPDPLTPAADSLVYWYAVIIGAIYLISLVFDIHDSYLWLSGKDRSLIVA